MNTWIAFMGLLMGSADAAPTGPNVSLGSNPIWNYIGTCDNLSYVVPAGRVLVITDVQKVSISTSSSYWMRVKIDGVSFLETYNIDLYSYQTGIKVSEGQQLTCQRNYNVNVMLSGYFTAP